LEGVLHFTSVSRGFRRSSFLTIIYLKNREKSTIITTTNVWSLPESNQKALDFLPTVAPGKSNRVVIALELPYAAALQHSTSSYHSPSWFTLAADAIVEVFKYFKYQFNAWIELILPSYIKILVRHVNNCTKILPNHIIEIVRVNNKDPDPNVSRNGGYAMNQVYEFQKQYSNSDSKLTLAWL
jgi:hypothetical protein